MGWKCLVAAVLFAALPVVAADAAVTTSGALQQEDSIQSNYKFGVVQDDNAVIWFREQSEITLGSNVTVDITQTGLYDSESDLSGAGGTLPSGAFIMGSYYVHFDPVTSTGTTLTGTFTFTGGEIVRALIVKGAQLFASDSELGHPSVSNYGGNDTTRGLELNGDSITISADRTQVSFSMTTTGRIDSFRIITTPEPSTFLLSGLGLAGLGYAARKRRRTKTAAK